ncbi:MAG: hypothetical protein V1915_03075 [Candidatus Bathyarchaeota archaeon]
MDPDPLVGIYTPEWDSDLTLPYYYKELQKKVISRNILKENLRNFKEIAKKHQACTVNSEDLEDLSLQNSVFKRNSKELWDESYRVSDRVRPILAFYAHEQYAAFFIYTLFKHPRSGGHGLSIDWGEGKKQGIESIQVELRPDGFFRRLVDTYTILGHPNAYGLFLPLQQLDRSYVFKENDLVSRLPIGKIEVLSLMDFDSENFRKEFTPLLPKIGGMMEYTLILLIDF